MTKRFDLHFCDGLSPSFYFEANMSSGNLITDSGFLIPNTWVERESTTIVIYSNDYVELCGKVSFNFTFENMIKNYGAISVDNLIKLKKDVNFHVYQDSFEYVIQMQHLLDLYGLPLIQYSYGEPFFLTCDELLKNGLGYDMRFCNCVKKSALCHERFTNIYFPGPPLKLERH